MRQKNLFVKIRKEFNRGFTLTEIAVVIVFFTLVGATVYGLYAFNQRVSREREAAAEITQNGRVVLERITRELRQAKEIVTDLPEERSGASSEILFQDGHLNAVIEQGAVRASSLNTLTLSGDSSSKSDFYKDMFIKIVAGSGLGQIRKIVAYDGNSKTAEIETDWEILPQPSSVYRIDSSYYYIHYYKDENNNVFRRMLVYYFSGDSNAYVPWNAIPPQFQTKETAILEESRLVGEYVSGLEFWGAKVVNVFISLRRDNQEINLSTKVFGRNL